MHFAAMLIFLFFADNFCALDAATIHPPVVVDLSWSSPSARVIVEIFPATLNGNEQSSSDRLLQLNFEACSACSYRWKQLPNSYTKRIISVGKEFISTDTHELTRESGKMRYHFLAFKPGRATLTFEYGSRFPGPADTTYRVIVYIAIKHPTFSIPAITTTPAPVPAASSAPPTPIEAWLNASSRDASYELSVNQVVNLYLANYEGCQNSTWTIAGTGTNDELNVVVQAIPACASAPGRTVFSFMAVGSGAAYLHFRQSDDSFLAVMITVAHGDLQYTAWP
uniref:Proteinase inhibitor I42 chagasin domain-containing protein n=1 Tax=Cryptomonas curvata TaxID=233186 RepID=A0A7S0N2C8_9CRYP|mmetsp:Transcript_59398/g.124113  ORF Transcript_59398/g.124113 Transcript_59398/m.124113 type:complete len:281 (+) Transcript_59398:27-869(+)|eukprot:CAMPEP_0172172932 /NCGR_PEP_ID=MMETSP1050-20130122/12738_1 /TAXON_ID=233186 /ORGANISM="Cryptomonas curvata, Strain CCAP979/52" /LENGTH=280 /DNA_ID=CAMNT_0012844561 /DNA_START=22 /DNA_END=864 /DNA_ORIENTATION=+